MEVLAPWGVFWLWTSQLLPEGDTVVVVKVNAGLTPGTQYLVVDKERSVAGCSPFLS